MFKKERGEKLNISHIFITQSNENFKQTQAQKIAFNHSSDMNILHVKKCHLLIKVE